MSVNFTVGFSVVGDITTGAATKRGKSGELFKTSGWNIDSTSANLFASRWVEYECLDNANESQVETKVETNIHNEIEPNHANGHFNWLHV